MQLPSLAHPSPVRAALGVLILIAIGITCWLVFGQLGQTLRQSRNGDLSSRPGPWADLIQFNTPRGWTASYSSIKAPDAYWDTYGHLTIDTKATARNMISCSTCAEVSSIGSVEISLLPTGKYTHSIQEWTTGYIADQEAGKGSDGVTTYGGKTYYTKPVFVAATIGNSVGLCDTSNKVSYVPSGTRDTATDSPLNEACYVMSNSKIFEIRTSFNRYNVPQQDLNSYLDQAEQIIQSIQFK